MQMRFRVKSAREKVYVAILAGRNNQVHEVGCRAVCHVNPVCQDGQ